MPTSFYKKDYLQPLLVCLCSLGLLGYIIHKAYHLSFTHDEAYTYTHYVHQSFMDIISYKTPFTNNHILNTVFMKYSEATFGSSEIALRLPNILAFILYSVFTFFLIYRHNPKLALPCYLLFTLNPYLLDFFALARGYGLSIAFLMMSIYYISIYFNSRKKLHLILFNVGAFLAVMSNFSLLNYYVAALLVYNMMELINHKNSYHVYRTNKVNLIAVLISGMVLYEPLRRIAKMSLLDFGGKNGFVEDTVGTAVYSLFYEMHVPDFYMVIMKSITVFIVGFILVTIIFKSIKKDEAFFKTYTTLMMVNLVLLTIVLITILQHFILGNDYYIHRFALFFYPLFILNVSFLTIYFYEKGYFKLTLVSSYVMVALFSYNLLLNHNLLYFKDWKQDYAVKTVMKVLVNEHQKQPDKKMRLGINWLFEPATNFYRYTWNLKWLNPTHRRGVNKNDDYVLLLKTDKEFEALSTKPAIYSDELAGIVLLKNSN